MLIGTFLLNRGFMNSLDSSENGAEYWVGLRNPSGAICTSSTCTGSLQWQDGSDFAFGDSPGVGSLSVMGDTCLTISELASVPVQARSQHCDGPFFGLCQGNCTGLYIIQSSNVNL